MERQCKFHVTGCQYVGAGAALKDHLAGCSFGEKITEEKQIVCKQLLWGGCEVKLSMEEMVGHLKQAHGGIEKTSHSGKFSTSLSWGSSHDKFRTWRPEIFTFKDHTFMFHAYVWKSMWIFLVTCLGNEDEAKKYEVKMSILKKGGQHFYMGFRGKVFSTQDCAKDLLKDRTQECPAVGEQPGRN